MKSSPLLLVLLCALAALPLKSQAGSVDVPVDPGATYLRTQGDSGSRDAVPIDLFGYGIFPGDVIRLERLGTFASSVGFSGSQSGMAAVFSTSSTLLANTNVNRVPGAVEAGSDVTTPPTQAGNLQTNITQDFSPSNTDLTVPPNAQFLFVTGIDRFFGDNTDSDGDFKIRVTKVATGVIFSSDDTIDESNDFYESANVVVQGCTVTITGSHHFYGLRLENNAVVNHRANTDAGMNVRVDTDVQVAAGSSINANGKGYPARVGPGAGTGNMGQPGGGGGYGGRGGNSDFGFPGGPCYGDFRQPTLKGSGGGGSNPGAGGGVLKLSIGGTLQCDGIISANGQDAQVNDGSAGGSGGSIWIESGSIGGNGVIRANGGGGSYGGGGGGRIALYYQSDASQTSVQTIGGSGGNGRQAGGGGTVFRKLPSQTNGTLIIKNIPGNSSAAITSLSGALTLDEFRIGDSAIAQEPSQETLVLTIAGNLVVEQSGRLSADGSGFPSHFGPGAGTGNMGQPGGGGGYGGRGGNSDFGFPGGPCYGDFRQPTLKGSGGGGSNPGAGGGVLKLSIGGTLQCDGIISANGQDAQVNDGSAGGSGGSIWIESGSIGGNGVIRANGGGGSYGGGGGGRIALYYQSDASQTSVQTIGGSGGNGRQAGGGGTVFRKLPSQTNGTLIIKNIIGNTNPAATEFQGLVLVDIFVIADNAKISPLIGDTSMHLIAGTMSVETGSAILADNLGWPARQGPGRGEGGLNQGGGGGGYGGKGGNGANNLHGGQPYATCFDPIDLGSGGGGSNGGAGGGTIRVTVSGTLTVDGLITSRGQDAQANDGSGGGSGGSIWLTAGTLAGSGSIKANGGNGSWGGGSGGRIALYINSLTLNPSFIEVSGGAGGNGQEAGQLGTVFAGTPLLPTGFSVVEGQLFQGNLASLYNVDGAFVSAFDDADTLQATIQVNTTCPTATPKLVGLTATTYVTRQGLAQVGRIFNYSSNEWDDFASYEAVPAGLKIGTCYSSSEALSYLGPNREMKVRIHWEPINDEVPSQDGWLQKIDQVQWRVVQ